MVRAVYEFDSKPLGHGASGEGEPELYIGFHLSASVLHLLSFFSIPSYAQADWRSVCVQDYSKRR